MIKDLFRNIGTKGKALAGAAILSATLSALAALGITIVFLKMMEQVTIGPTGPLYVYWWALAGITVLRMVFYSLGSISRHFAAFEIVARIKEKIILRLKQYSLGFYTKERLGEISTVIHNDADNLGELWVFWPPR